jgi:hypothetical protein
MKTLCLLFSALMITQFLNAQIEGGARLGLNLSNQKWKLGMDSQTDDMKVGLSVGGYANIKIRGAFSVQPELLFNSMGSKTSEGKYSLQYISIPVLGRYDINDLFEVHIGPQISFLLSSKYSGVNIKDSYENLDIGAVIGVGIKIDALQAGVRYYRGFNNTFAENAADIQLTQSAIQLFAGYRLFGGD